MPTEDPTEGTGRVRRTVQPATGRRKRRKRLLRWGVGALAVLVLVGGATAWLGVRAIEIKDNLDATAQLLPKLKNQLLANDASSASDTVASLAEHTAAAKQAGSDPLWKLASSLPWLGPNLAAASEITTTADDVVRLAAQPLVGTFESLDWKSLTPVDGAVPLAPLQKAAPSVVSAANSVELSYERLAGIDPAPLLPQIADPLDSAKVQLDELRGLLSTASDAAQLVPPMMGAEAPRDYLLLIQNNAEVRASGGIPGALAVIHAENGKISLAAQDSASAMGDFTPPVKVDAEQEAIYSNRMGSYMQDVNMTPDFPTAASTAKDMWLQRHPEQPIDGVISIDPVALALVLKTTGPITVAPALPAGVSLGDLPTQLTSTNLVPVLLSQVYAEIEEPALQDAYFAAVAKEVFDVVASGKTPGDKLVQTLATGVSDNRILMWSAHGDEQAILGDVGIGGAISGPSVPAAGFGVYFNDGTGAKMDYYVKRTVQLVQRCNAGGYAEYTAKITMTNTAPADAATSLPAYVTGDAVFGVPHGSVATNVVAYGPTQARTQEARIDGKVVGISSHSHDERPVGIVRVQLAPGQQQTVEIDFSKVVQTSPAQLSVTPTIQKKSDVILPEQKVTGCTGE
ncbi:DUF4012 domain-containing protein [Arthrobacter sp. H35-D1]|uniref:DUF4012 domain-containing protein n=1 Tax=Arthrobacter sp. H35-D1 TaxID=3046202 RepID=UPI0024BA93B0|nr:DUF4012 domain-containing protein [Arthrobacter sp. H35-D1]MDJ0315368.1 DUF4012 domain-containing protein [Arthrobacter sp. H35-D1]